MKWTSDKPTKSGFYWIRDSVLKKSSAYAIISIHVCGDGIFFYDDDVAKPFGAFLAKFQFAGPIPRPDEDDDD